MSDFIHFIARQLFEDSFELSVKDNLIVLQKDGHTYSEPYFDPFAQFNENDILALEDISSFIESETELQKINIPIHILKNWYLLTHEKYFKNDLIFDRYGRIGQENLRDDFYSILKVPIADVLKHMFQNHFNSRKNAKPTIYLTCDFDILNVWDVWNIKDLVREILYCSKKLQIRKLYETIGSFLFSRKVKSFNGYLNELMYDFDPRITNIGFFISSPQNRKYDGLIDYKNQLVQSYLQNLKSKGVIFGLHTNYETQDNPKGIHDQIKDFETLFKTKTTYNRHHYLRFHFPDYLRTLEAGQIEIDFSLYFPESMLFRAGTCSSYFAWNVIENRPFKTKLIPTTIMDGTFSDYLYCDYKTAITKSQRKIDLTLEYSDSLVLLWHNRSTYKYCNIENNYHPELIKELISYLKAKTLN